MRQRSQLVGDIKDLAQGELKQLWNKDYDIVVEHAIYGKECDFLDLTNAQGTVPWDLLRLLVGHPDTKTHIHSSGVRITNAHITTGHRDRRADVLLYDFFLCTSSRPLLFKNCLFDGELRFDYCKLKSLGFIDSTIQSVHMRAAEVEGGATFDGCFFNKVGELSIKAHEVKVGGTLCLRKCVALGGIRLMGSRIGADLDATGAFVVSTRYGEYFWGKGNLLDAKCVQCLRDFYGVFDALTPDLALGVERIHDIMRAAILKNQHYDLQFNQDFLEFANHYTTVIIPCTPYSPEQKGKVESGVKYMQMNFVSGRTFTDDRDIANKLNDWMDNYANKRVHGTTRKVPVEVLQNVEKQSMQPLPDEPFAFFNRGVHKVAPNCHIHFENNYYSVPFSLAYKEVTVRWNESLVRIIFQGEQVALHLKASGLPDWALNRSIVSEQSTVHGGAGQRITESRLSSVARVFMETGAIKDELGSRYIYIKHVRDAGL